MLKQTQKAGSSRSSQILLYDRVRDDIFENQQHHRTVVIPSITTIALLQLQAYTIQLLTLIPQQRQQRQSSGILASILRRYSPLNVIRQTLRWILLIGLLLLDNVARILNVESEMNRMVTDSNEEDNKSTACDTFIEDQEEHSPKLEEHEQINEKQSLHINVAKTQEFHVAGELLKKPSYRDIHDQCRSSEPSTPTTTTVKRCSRPCCETPRNTSNNNKSGLVIDSRPFVSPSSPNSPTPSFVQQRASHTPRTRKISSPSAIMTTSTSTSTSSYHQPHHILKVSADSSPVLGPLLRPGTRHVRSLSNNMVLSQVPKIVAENKTSLQQQQTLRRIGAQREITVPNNNVPPPRQKRSLVPNILKKKKSPAPSNATTTSSSSESSTTKEPLHPEYLRSPKLQKSLSTATEHHHHHHHHKEDHQYNVKTMGEFLQENPLIRKDVY